jgi:hypothetical protein
MAKHIKPQGGISGLEGLPKLTRPQWTIAGLATLAAFILVALSTAPH